MELQFCWLSPGWITCHCRYWWRFYLKAGRKWKVIYCLGIAWNFSPGKECPAFPFCLGTAKGNWAFSVLPASCIMCVSKGHCSELLAQSYLPNTHHPWRKGERSTELNRPRSKELMSAGIQRLTTASTTTAWKHHWMTKLNSEKPGHLLDTTKIMMGHLFSVYANNCLYHCASCKQGSFTIYRTDYWFTLLTLSVYGWVKHLYMITSIICLQFKMSSTLSSLEQE